MPDYGTSAFTTAYSNASAGNRQRDLIEAQKQEEERRRADKIKEYMMELLSTAVQNGRAPASALSKFVVDSQSGKMVLPESYSVPAGEFVPGSQEGGQNPLTPTPVPMAQKRISYSNKKAQMTRDPVTGKLVQVSGPEGEEVEALNFNPHTPKPEKETEDQQTKYARYITQHPLDFEKEDVEAAEEHLGIRRVEESQPGTEENKGFWSSIFSSKEPPKKRLVFSGGSNAGGGGGGDDASLRDQAVQILMQNKKQVNEKTVKTVMERLRNRKK